MELPQPWPNNGDDWRISDSTTTFNPYHSGNGRGSSVPPETRPFIAWDGEGISILGKSRPQAYVLFGCSTGEYVSSDGHLHTFELLDFILDVGRKNPTAFHVGFAFNYDANMLLRSLSEHALRIVHHTGGVSFNRPGLGRYRIEFRPSKWFSVTRFGEKYDRKRNPHDKVHVKIFDLFGFFVKSFEAAYTQLIGPVPSILSKGKAARGSFTSNDMAYVLKYWQVEIQMLCELAGELRKRLYGAGIRITSWHGPGALASYVLRTNGVKAAKASCPDEVREAARYGYAGGRFEMFKLGRINGPIYSLDVNSAYPYGIAQLPNLAAGEWIYQTFSPGQPPTRIARFGIYYVRLRPDSSGTFLERAPGPLFHRDKMGNISFPWVVEGWYWSPEVKNLSRLMGRRVEILQGWTFRRVHGKGEPYPFKFIEEMYEQRREWKRKGYASELALKLAMNSIYGKLAQRVGWNEEKRTAPTWHQLEWAGWVTSYCRSMLWSVMSKAPRDSLIAVETDGLYTTANPASLGISDSKALGGWSIDEYDEILYVQSGMAWLRRGDKWTCKRRGLDSKTFTREACEQYLRQLGPSEIWAPYVGETTRFIGVGAALASTVPFKFRHCVWQTINREIRPGQGGKRVHIHTQCAACMDGKTAWEAPHDMSIRSLAYKDPHSYPHSIPWEDYPSEYDWRAVADVEKQLVAGF